MKRLLLPGRLKPKSKELRELLHLKAEMLELSRRMRAFQPRWMGKSEGSSVEFEPEPVFKVGKARSIRNKEKSIQTKTRSKALRESKGSSMEFESYVGGKSISKQKLQVSNKQFMNLQASISKSVAKSIGDMPKAEETVVPPRGSFKLGLISPLLDEMWDDIRELVSTELEVLATCMLTPLAGHISALRLISAQMEWLCTWGPEFAQKLQCINANEEIEEGMEDGEKIEEHMFASYISCWEQTQSRGYCCRFEDPTDDIEPNALHTLQAGQHPILCWCHEVYPDLLH